MKGGSAPTFNDRQLAGEVRQLGLKHLKRILSDDFEDKALQHRIIEKISTTLLPRLQEVTGEDGEPIVLEVTNYATKVTK